jgi:uncharacterized membrane-anchored protein
MRLRFAIAAIVLQVLMLAYIAGEREWILRTGKTVWLRTAPIDPQDAMRGDYVRLDYDISRVERALWRDGLAVTNQVQDLARRDTKVFASLRVAPDSRAEIVSLSDQRPAEGLFLRGRIEPSWGSTLKVRYGIEAFFMEQGRAEKLENQRLQERRGVPLNTEVALGRNGIGVLKGYRWESLGIVVEFDTLQRTNHSGGFPRQQSLITAAKVELKNHGPEDVAIVEFAEGRSFALVPDTRWGETLYRWPGETNAVPHPQPENIIVLKPGQSHHTRLDLTRPEWFVVDTRPEAQTPNAVPLQKLEQDWNARFRLEYRPPPAEACASLPNAKLIYHGRLPSRAFNPVGMVD